MKPNSEAARATALEFLRSNHVGVLATASLDGAPHARTLYYSADKDFGIYFLTFSDTRKVEDLLANERAALVVSDPDKPVTLQIEGVVSDRTEMAAVDENIEALLRTFQARGDTFAPLNHLDPTRVTFFKLTPTWIRWGDFTSGMSTEEVFSEIHPSADEAS